MRIKKHPILKFNQETLNFVFEGKKVKGKAGDTIASALIASGIKVFSYSQKLNRPRGFNCSIDFCDGTCMMTVDGISHVKTCKTILKENMKVYRMKGKTQHEDL